jgi:hypothetical protein
MSPHLQRQISAHIVYNEVPFAQVTLQITPTALWRLRMAATIGVAVGSERPVATLLLGKSV